MTSAMTALKQAIGSINRDIENRKIALASGRHDGECEKIAGEIAGLKLAIERLREVETGAVPGADARWVSDALVRQLIEAAGDLVATYPAGSEWSPEQLRLKAAWWECVR